MRANRKSSSFSRSGSAWVSGTSASVAHPIAVVMIPLHRAERCCVCGMTLRLRLTEDDSSGGW